MASLNQASIIGNVGADPDCRSTQSGVAVASFSVATSDKWKDKTTGEAKERTEWHRVVVWDKLAEIVEKYVRKGSKIFVQGKLQTRKWTDSNGTERYTTEIVVSGFDAKVVLLDKANGGGRPPPPDKAPEGYGAPRPRNNDLDDDVPF